MDNRLKFLYFFVFDKIQSKFFYSESTKRGQNGKNFASYMLVQATN